MLSISSLTRVSLFVATGLILFLFESAIPNPLPWLKPGLSNLVTLVALAMCGFRIAALVVVLRILLGALILGTLLTPVFVFALCGGLAALCVMGFLLQCFRDKFSLIGISVAGAFIHNIVQILLAAFVFIGNKNVLIFLPAMALSSLFSGFLVGIFAHYTAKRLPAI